MSFCRITILTAVAVNTLLILSVAYAAPLDTASSPDGDVCLLPPVVGDCQGAFLRYFYDPCTAQCLPFYYGGCGGNANNFETLEECEAACFGGEVIPAVSEWGLVAMMLLLLTGVTVVRRRAVA